jgi:hypothetical protein
MLLIGVRTPIGIPKQVSSSFAGAELPNSIFGGADLLTSEGFVGGDVYYKRR